MGEKSLFKKAIALAIIIVFFSTSILPSISGIDIENYEQKNIITQNREELEKKVTVTCYNFGMPGQPSKEIEIPQHEAEYLYGKIKELNFAVAIDPLSERTQQLQIEIVDLADEYDLLPTGLSKNEVKKRNLQAYKAQTNRVKFSPQTQGKASEFLCTFVSTGSGGVLPIIALPRLIPILMIPIPRLFMIWRAQEAVTSCGGLRSGTGFIAYGQQNGIALGFWGLGFTFSLPPLMGVYGLAGYSLYASVNADGIEFYPPNSPPVISQIDPGNGEINVPLSLSELRFQISDLNGELMSYTVTTSPDIGSGSGNLKPDGVYSIPISGLEDLTEYSWHIEVTDGMDTTIDDYSFTTEANAPIVSDPDPYDGEKYISVGLSQLSFHLKDYQGDPIDYTVETKPNIGSGSGSDVGEGTYSISVSGLDYNTEYLWFVNTSDGEHESRKVFSFQSEFEMTFDPFNSNWMYKKQITIDHILVDGDLENFPVLFSTTDVDLRDKAQADGDDILFMNDEGVADRLFHEIESYDESTGELIAWVNVDDLYSDQDANLYMYYGNLNAGDQQAPEFVWNPNFKAVWHLRDFKDSTVHNNNGNNHGSTDISGKIDIAKNLDGENDYISISDDSSLNFHSSNKFSISFWLSKRLSNKYESIVSKGTTAYNKGYHVQIKANYSISFGIRTGSEYFICYSNTLINDLDWHHVVSVWDGTKLNIYIDGNLDVSRDIGEKTIADDQKSLEIGDHYPMNNGHKFAFDGILEEMRFSNIDYDVEWISTEYNNQNDPLNFYSVGPEISSP